VQLENVIKRFCQPTQNDITFLMKKLVMIRAKVPTTLEGGNHGHTNTILPQLSKTPSHTVEPRVENSSQVTNNTPKPRVETTITLQPIKTPSTQWNQGWKTPVK
jgi:hypothetical protein